MLNIIGREREKKKLSKILSSGEPEFLAIYGRRCVGKTFLIHEFFHNKGLYFELIGQKDAVLIMQLENFYQAIQETFQPKLPIKKPDSWKEALSILTTLVEAQPAKKKIILFFDELPWLATKRSELLQALEYEWNRKWSRNNNLKLIVCGSAASWVIENLIQAKGGLHNRITATIHLQPFTLNESSRYLKSRGAQLKPLQILELYMAIGGIPHYLRQVEKGKSSTQISCTGLNRFRKEAASDIIQTTG
jgi:AAA+ ATPase superfamily predicted ATPase